MSVIWCLNVINTYPGFAFFNAGQGSCLSSSQQSPGLMSVFENKRF